MKYSCDRRACCCKFLRVGAVRMSWVGSIDDNVIPPSLRNVSTQNAIMMAHRGAEREATAHVKDMPAAKKAAH